MSEIKEKYLKAVKDLSLVRELHQGKESEEELLLLGILDELWEALPDEERDELHLEYDDTLCEED